MSPVWTAGGRIWFHRPGQLWVMDADGSNATQLSASSLLLDAWPVGVPLQP